MTVAELLPSRSFDSDLEQSKLSNERIEDLIRNRFGKDVVFLWNNTPGDDKGVDVCVLIRGKDTYFDIKRFQHDYSWQTRNGVPTVCLEYESSPGKPGWLTKTDVLTDWVCIYCVETDRALFLHFDDLQQAYKRFGKEWKERALKGEPGYKHVVGQNRTYQSKNITVPYDKLCICIARCNIVEGK